MALRTDTWMNQLIQLNNSKAVVPSTVPEPEHIFFELQSFLSEELHGFTLQLYGYSKADATIVFIKPSLHCGYPSNSQRCYGNSGAHVYVFMKNK